VTRPLADTLFQFDGIFLRVGCRHHISELSYQFVSGVVARHGRCGGPMIVAGGAVPMGQHLAHWSGARDQEMSTAVVGGLESECAVFLLAEDSINNAALAIYLFQR
jgi:hypothetical protein